MSNTFTNLLYHVVFSTKYRRETITTGLRTDLYSYIGGIIQGRDGIALEIGWTADHIHILTKLSPRLAIMDVVRDIKSFSSKWVNERQPEGNRFEWQTGYGAFSVSSSHLEDVRRYIQNQQEHHRRTTFKSEFVMKYVFDEEHVASPNMKPERVHLLNGSVLVDLPISRHC